MPNQALQSPFLDIKSFVSEELAPTQESLTAAASPSSPFLSVYESEDGDGLINSEADEYVEFLNELYDEEFDQALFELVNEATAVSESRFSYEDGDPRGVGYEAERLLNEYFMPLETEASTMLGSLVSELSRRDLSNLTADEIDTLVDRYRPSIELSPSFENFFGALKNAVKKVAGKAVSLAKKGISAAAKLGLGPILNKLRALIKPLLKRVIQTAIGKLPTKLQPLARKLAERLPFLKEVEEGYAFEAENNGSSDISQIQNEFDQQVANLLFASNEVELEAEFAQLVTQQQVFETYPLAELDRARDQFVQNLLHVREGEDPTPHVENFVPAILPALRIGIKIAGRKRVVDFLAKFVGKLIKKFVGPQYAPALSQAIVDAGLRLIHLEATPEDESQAAASAVAATVEETVRRVAALPDYVLDNQELLEGFTLEAFEQAAAANLPAVLPERVYRKRPALAEGKRFRGTWIMMPRGRRKRFKKFTRRLPAKLTPHKVAAIETFGATPLDEFLEEELGVEPGEEVDATVHLYETLPGTQVSDIARLDEDTPGLGTHVGYEQLHPLTPEAAGLLLGEPGLGREVDTRYLANPYTTTAGQRFYYLEIPGKRPLVTPEPAGRAKTRRPTRVKLVLDFPKNEIRLYLFLSEIRAQDVAVKLRQHAHIGTVTAQLQRLAERGLRRALSGGRGGMKIVHEAVTPDQWLSALGRLPSLVPQILSGRLKEWVLKALSDQLKQHVQEFIKAAEDTTDGVTLLISIGNPPGFSQLRQALKGKGLSLSSLKMSDGTPTVNIKITPGHSHE